MREPDVLQQGTGASRGRSSLLPLSRRARADPSARTTHDLRRASTMSNETLAGRRVRGIGYGAMQPPGRGVFGPPADRDAALAVLRRAIELGVNHIDTSQYYGPD